MCVYGCDVRHGNNSKTVEHKASKARGRRAKQIYAN